MQKIDTLYLIDDDDVFQFITERVIKETELVSQIQIFNNGKNAIEYIKSKQDTPEQLPDIILLDIFMPILDGWGFLDEFLKLKPLLNKKITIYIISSSIAPSDVERAENTYEVSDYIIKPVTREKFLNIMENL